MNRKSVLKCPINTSLKNVIVWRVELTLYKNSARGDGGLNWVFCRPTSPESLTCHLDWDSDHPPSTNWLFHLATSLLSAGGPLQSPPPISGTVSLHISHQYRRSLFSGSVLRLLFRRSYPDLIIWLHSVVDLVVTLSFRPHYDDDDSRSEALSHGRRYIILQLSSVSYCGCSLCLQELWMLHTLFSMLVNACDVQVCARACA